MITVSNFQDLTENLDAAKRRYDSASKKMIFYDSVGCLIGKIIITDSGPRFEISGIINLVPLECARLCIWLINKFEIDVVEAGNKRKGEM